jgi:hypothetical protein
MPVAVALALLIHTQVQAELAVQVAVVKVGLLIHQEHRQPLQQMEQQTEAVARVVRAQAQQAVEHLPTVVRAL